MPTRGSDEAMQLLESGQVDYAFVDCDTFLALAAQQKTTATAVYVWLDRPTLGIVSKTPLSGPKALMGKSFGTTPQSTARTILPFVLKSDGVDPSTVNVQPVDFSVIYALFFSGQLDTAEIHAPGSWQNVELQSEGQGKKVYLTVLKDWGLVGYDKILVVRNQLLHDDPAGVKRAAQSIDASLQQARAHASDDQASALLAAAVAASEAGGASRRLARLQEPGGAPRADRPTRIRRVAEPPEGGRDHLDRTDGHFTVRQPSSLRDLRCY